MFTGIIEEIGHVRLLQCDTNGGVMRLRCPDVSKGATLGQSVAVDGACLTVTGIDGDDLTFDVMPETFARTCLGRLEPGDPVNLERAVPASGRLNGHIVQGHVDGTGRIAAITPAQRWSTVRFTLPAHLARYVAEKGSIAVDGVSLTVTAVAAPGAEPWFEVGLIPTTLRETVLGSLEVGDPVNLEVDVLAKYVENLSLHGAIPADQPTPADEGDHR
ncbi:riboflavin synthase [Acidipropionibacterium timonense]|uniref:riboflavin synthase n=1 Tax=Acidipropionibacterium timonense TaxID=2161818 RepID=UPI00103009D9|nr:riboflavin synthase [Acidipropionibacterium timonense]